VIGRGELWWADLGLPRGSAPATRRPVLVISGDPYNRSSLRTVTVVVLTTTTQLAALPGNVVVPAGGQVGQRRARSRAWTTRVIVTRLANDRR
jgi:mRNA-degrading endonuclease toxin of MazEF toxin-antitoxin module